MSEPKQFANRMDLLAENLGKGSLKAVRKAALAIHQTVALGTPVDTGRARSNWRVFVNLVQRDTIEAHAPGKNLGQAETANLTKTLEQGSLEIAKAKLGSILIINNNLPYIQRLNEGWSAQAPANFIEAAVIEASQAVKGVSLLEG